MVRAPYTLPPSIEAAITESIIAPPCKRTRSPSPPPSPSPLPSPSPSPSPLPSPSPPPQVTIVEATAKAATVPPCKRYQMTPLHSIAIVEVRTEHIVPLLVARIAPYESEIHALYDQMEEILLTRLDSMSQQMDGFYPSTKADQQDRDATLDALVLERAPISDLESRQDESKAKEAALERRMRAMEKRFGPPSSS
ncbi:hypothetical protein Tco_1028032 [Tanacetum coccineum]